MPRKKMEPAKLFETIPYDAEKEKKQNIVGVRIAEARRNYGMSANDLSEHLLKFGLEASGAAINKWEIGNSSPNVYQFLAVCCALNIRDPLKYFALEYAPPLNDEGMRKVAAYLEDLIATGKYPPRRSDAGVIEYIDMPVSNLRVSAGTGAFLDEGAFETIRFPSASVPARAKFGVRVSGDSMEPVYNDGQIVWVEPCERVKVGEVGIFIYDGEGYIKAYGEQDPSPDVDRYFTDSRGVQLKQPVLISYNEAYEPKIISPFKELRTVGRVL